MFVFHGENKHGVRFYNMQGKFVAFKPSVQLPKIVVDSISHLIQITGLVAYTGIVSLHGNSRISNSQWKIIDINQEK